MDQAKGKANGFSSTLSTLSKNVASFMVYDVGKKLVTGFVDATKAGISYNAMLETSKISWTNLLNGSENAANKMIARLEKLAAITPFDYEGVDTFAKKLEMAGLGGKDLEKNIIAVGDAVSAVGGNTETLNGVATALTQISMKGKVSAEEMQQLAERGIPAYKLLAEGMGVTEAQLMDLMKDGEVMANEALPILISQMEKAFGGSMASQVGTFNAGVSTLKDRFKALAGHLSKPLFDKLTEGINKVNPILEKLTASLGSEAGFIGTIRRFVPGIEPFVQTAISIFTTMGESVGVIIQSMTNFWNEHSSWLMPLITFVWGFISNVILNTITAIGTIVQSGLAVIDGVINFFQNLFKGNFSGCWESIKQIFSNAIAFVISWLQVSFVAKGISLVKNMATGIPNLIKGLWSSGKNLFSQGVSACINFVKNLLSGATSNFNTLRTFGANAFQALWSVAKTMMSNLLNSVISNIRQVPTTISNFMNQAVNVLKGINLFSIGKNMIQGLINGIKNMAGNVVGAIGSVVNGAISKVKKTLGINSPSKLFTQFGKWTGEGLAIGIDDENNRVTKASKGLASSVIGGYNANLRGIKVNTNNNNRSTLENNNPNKATQATAIFNIDGREFMRTIAKYKDELEYYDERNPRFSY